MYLWLRMVRNCFCTAKPGCHGNSEHSATLQYKPVNEWTTSDYAGIKFPMLREMCKRRSLDRGARAAQNCLRYARRREQYVLVPVVLGVPLLICCVQPV